MTRVAWLPNTFGESLRFLRKRAHLTQDELGRAVGYSREQITRLENGSRLPDLAVVAALFIPVLLPKQEENLVAQFLALAGQTHASQQVVGNPTGKIRTHLTSETPLNPVTPAHSPPQPLLPLIGREAEISELLALMQMTRLITLLGAPGIGKSRLALEIAHLAMPGFADGVAFIPLADVTAASDVPYAVLRALSITPTTQQSLESAIQNYLSNRRLLLVLDNCEHILESAPLFTDWLAQAPHLKLLCTSRMPLDLYGEQEWPVPPLPTPNLAEPPNLARWQQLPALQLLLARVRAADPDFSVNADNILHLATLCVALDGLPLALELAAVRLRDLPPRELVQQLLTLRGNGQLSSTWLQQTKRNLAERHRTLRAAIDWSVRMLTPGQQNAFFRLGIFMGGCTQSAAQEVAAADPELLTQLARASLINYTQGRVTLLETLRAFAYEQLAGSDTLMDQQQTHAAFYTAYAREIFTGLLGDDQATWMQLALADHANCLAALRWALSHNQGQTAISLAGSLWWFWYRRGLFSLGLEMLQAALHLSTPDLSARATALNGLASVYLALDEYSASLACHQEGLSLRRQLGDTAGIATIYHNMGLTAYMMGDYTQSLTWLDESITADPAADPMQSWANKGIVYLDMLDFKSARCWLERAYDRVSQQPEGWVQAFVMCNLADVLREIGELETAKRLAHSSLRIFETLGDTLYLPDSQLVLARIAGDEGDYPTALAFAELALAQYEARQDNIPTASVRLYQAEVSCKMGEYSAAAIQFKQARDQRQSAKLRPHSPREQARYAAVMKILSHKTT